MAKKAAKTKEKKVEKEVTELENYALVMEIIEEGDIPIREGEIEDVTQALLESLDGVDEADERVTKEMVEWFNAEAEKRGLFKEEEVEQGEEKVEIEEEPELGKLEEETEEEEVETGEVEVAEEVDKIKEELGPVKLEVKEKEVKTKKEKQMKKEKSKKESKEKGITSSGLAAEIILSNVSKGILKKSVKDLIEEMRADGRSKNWSDGGVIMALQLGISFAKGFGIIKG